LRAGPSSDGGKYIANQNEISDQEEFETASFEAMLAWVHDHDHLPALPLRVREPGADESYSLQQSSPVPCGRLARDVAG
jgi:hypothetical protein